MSLHLDAPLADFLKDHFANFRHLGIVVATSDERVRADGCDAALDVLAPLQSDQYGITFRRADTPPGETEAETSLDAHVRAALRQDPDYIAADVRGAQAAFMLWNAMLTGHRIVTGLAGETAAQGLDAFVEAAAREQDAALVRGTLASMAILEIAPAEFRVTSLWQVMTEGTLTRLFHTIDGRLEPTGASAYEPPPPPPPPPEAFTAVEVDPSWGEAGPILPGLREKMGRWRRPAWAPVLGPPPADAMASRFGGPPALADGEAWPRCGACGKPMMMVLQIALASAPADFQTRMGAHGCFQFFYCTAGDCTVDEAWAPWAANSLARVVEHPRASAAGVAAGAEHYPIRGITGWIALDDHPHSEERASLCGLTTMENEADWNADDFLAIAHGDPLAEGLRQRYDTLARHLGLETAADFEEIVRLLQCLPGDKLLGWPYWTQGPENVECRTCGRQMDQVLQINNDGFEGGAPGFTSCYGQIFAGDGNGHVFQCLDHPRDMTFNWACG